MAQFSMEITPNSGSLLGGNQHYEITKDKHVEIEFYLSDTSVKQAYEAGKTVVDVIGSAVDRMISDGKLDPATANLKPYLNDPDVLSQLGQCQSQASADFNPLHWIVTSAYAGAMCSIKTAGGVVAVGSADAGLMAGLQAEAALGFGIAALIASSIVIFTTGPAGDQKDQTVTLANGTVVSVTGVGDQFDRNVSITTNGNNTNLVVRDDGFGGLIISGGSINGQSMTYGELERAKRDLNNAGYDVVLSESAGGGGSSKAGASKGGSGAAAGAPDPDEPPRNKKASSSDVGERVRTPESDPDDFQRFEGNKYRNTKTGEIWEKSRTAHTDKAGEWKVGTSPGKAPRPTDKITVSSDGRILKF